MHATAIAGLENQRMFDDLAFARVTVGRRPGECASRLGLPSGLAYVEALRGSPSLDLVYVQKGSFARMDVEQVRATTDAARGSLLLLRPRNPADTARFQKGISGGTILLRWQNRSLPAAMVLGLAGNRGVSIRALRFDRIRAAFEALERSLTGAAPAKRPDTPRAEIVSVRGAVLGQSTSLGRLLETEGCWRAVPDRGQRAVELVILVPEPGRRGGVGADFDQLRRCAIAARLPDQPRHAL